MKITILPILILVWPFISCSQPFSNRRVLGEGYAKEFIKKALQDKNYKPFYDTLITDKTTVISVVEPILFKIYGEENIIDQRPYECYLINGYWYISGTLPKNTKGKTFEIILSSKNGQVIKLIHGK